MSDDETRDDEVVKRGPGRPRMPRAVQEKSEQFHEPAVRADRMEIDEEYLHMMQESEEYSTLPNLPTIPGYHVKWSSTTNQQTGVRRDLTYKYEFIRIEEMSEFYDSIKTAGHEKGGEYDGCIRFNEMIGMKLPLPKYNAIMYNNHYLMPRQQEEVIKEKINATFRDSRGQSLTRDVGDGFRDLGGKGGDSRPKFS